MKKIFNNLSFDYVMQKIHDTYEDEPDIKKCLYIHNDYCVEQCKYCIFQGQSILENISSYKENYNIILPTQLREVTSRIKGWSNVYFGGGTPSLMTLQHYEKIINSIDGYDSIPYKEIEINPNHISRELWKRILCDFTRVSIGIQSMDKEILAKCLRKYVDPIKIEQMLRECEAKEVLTNIDLMLYINETSEDEIRKTMDALEKTIKLGPSQITLYMNSENIVKGRDESEKWKSCRTIRWNNKAVSEIKKVFDRQTEYIVNDNLREIEDVSEIDYPREIQFLRKDCLKKIGNRYCSSHFETEEKKLEEQITVGIPGNGKSYCWGNIKKDLYYETKFNEHKPEKMDFTEVIIRKEERINRILEDK